MELKASYQEINRHGQRGGIVKGILILLFVIVLGGIVTAGVAGYTIRKEINQSGPATEEITVLIAPGMGVSSIASLLGQKGAIHSEVAFKIAARLKKAGSQLRAGEYLIPAGASINEILDILIEGKAIVHKLTIPEGLTTAAVLKLVDADEILEGEITLEPFEGRLLPETYGFTRSDTRDSVIKRMQEAQSAVLDELWEGRAANLPVKTKEDVIILASIVEKETGIAKERPLVASVFVNRLKRGIRLQSDPTIIYGLTKGVPLGRGLRLSELKKETPYNTYVINGLTPTPIANPGRDAIAAVLNPADTDYIFFVADDTGGHVFAKTLAEHNANVRNWRRIERERRNAQ